MPGLELSVSLRSFSEQFPVNENWKSTCRVIKGMGDLKEAPGVKVRAVFAD